jgi:RNA polymerase sigma factor (sigma-70 family)
MTKNSEYLEALVKGDSVIIETIYANNLNKVISFVLKNNGAIDDAKDVFQKALLQLAVRYKREPFEIRTEFDAYLFTVCKNLWRRELNKAKYRVTKFDSLEPKDEANDIALAVLDQQRWELFQEALNRLSNNCQEVLKLFFNKVSYEQIVQTFNYSSETVARQRVFKCKKKLIGFVKENANYKSLLEL